MAVRLKKSDESEDEGLIGKEADEYQFQDHSETIQYEVMYDDLEDGLNTCEKKRQLRQARTEEY